MCKLTGVQMQELEIVKEIKGKQIQPSGIDLRVEKVYEFIYQKPSDEAIKILHATFRNDQIVKLILDYEISLVLLNEDDYGLDKISLLELREVKPIEIDGKEFWILCSEYLRPKTYLLRLQEVEIPKNIQCLAFQRSTIFRHNAFIIHTIFDPEYYGYPVGLLIIMPIINSEKVGRNCILIQKGARISQLTCDILCKEVEFGYSGTYKGEK